MVLRVWGSWLIIRIERQRQREQQRERGKLTVATSGYAREATCEADDC